MPPHIHFAPHPFCPPSRDSKQKSFALSHHADGMQLHGENSNPANISLGVWLCPGPVNDIGSWTIRLHDGSERRRAYMPYHRLPSCTYASPYISNGFEAARRFHRNGLSPRPSSYPNFGEFAPCNQTDRNDFQAFRTRVAAMPSHQVSRSLQTAPTTARICCCCVDVAFLP